MFKDYYAILQIHQDATIEAIKVAYKKQALRWHPDKNPGMDTTVKMQEINEAYLILKDEDARRRYDAAYLRFTTYKKEQQQSEKTKEQEKTTTEETYSDAKYFNIEDDVLERWMQNAATQAKEMVALMLRDIKGVSTAAAQGCLQGILQLVFFTLIANAIFFLVKGCQ